MQYVNRTTLTLFFVGLLFLNYNYAQVEGCDGERYRIDVFSSVEVTEAVKFGENTTIGGNFQELFMDVYEPANDDLEARPAIVLAFGGGFVAGERESLDGICRSFARKGYVAVTIDYRLFDLLFPVDSSQMTDVVVKAVGDMKAAIRYLREDAATDNQFRINPEQIFVGGVSAGAITAAHVAYLDDSDELPSDIQSALNANGGWEGNSSDNIEYSSEAQGVINYSGALKDADLINGDNPPLFSVHDDGDGVVPYGNGSVPAGPIIYVYLEGSKTMHERAIELEIENELITIENSNGHVSYFVNNAAQYEEEVEAATANFLADILCGPMSSTSVSENYTSKVNVYPNPATDMLNVVLENNTNNYKLRIYDSMGKLILDSPAQNTAQQIDLEYFPNGSYYLQLIEDGKEQQIVWRKLIIQKH